MMPTIRRPGFSGASPRLTALLAAAVSLSAWALTACGEDTAPADYTVEEIRIRLQDRGLVVDSARPIQEVGGMTAAEGYRWVVRDHPLEIYRFPAGSRAARRSLEGARRRGIKRQPTVTVGNIAVLVGDHPDSTAIRRAILEEEDP